MNAIKDQRQPLWHREDNFAQKPEIAPYGYVLDGEDFPSLDIDELRQALQENKSLHRIQRIWTPNSPYLVLIGEVEGLLDIIKPNRIKTAKEQFKSSRLRVLIASIISIALAFAQFTRDGINFVNSPYVGMYLIGLLMFVLVPFYEAWKKLKTARNLNQSTLHEQSDEFRFEIWTMKQPCLFTKGMLAVLIVIALLQWLAPQFTEIERGFWETINYAGIRKDLIIHYGEGWRLWTAPFLHGNEVHIFMNASGLWYLGRRVEVLTRWTNLLFCYLLSIIASSYTSYFFLPEGVPSIGASGGIMGLLGFLLIFELLHPRLAPKPARRRLIGIIVLMAIMGVAGYQFIDNAAHAGGLVAGILYGFLGFRKSNTVSRPTLSTFDKVIGGVSMILLISAAILAVLKMYQLV